MVSGFVLIWFFRKLFQAFHHSQNPFGNEKVGSCFVTYSLCFVGISYHLSRCCGKDVGSFWLPLCPRCPFLKVAFIIKLSRCNGQHLLKRHSQSLPSLFLSQAPGLVLLLLCWRWLLPEATGSCFRDPGKQETSMYTLPKSVLNLNWLRWRVDEWHCKRHSWWEAEEQGCPFR